MICIYFNSVKRKILHFAIGTMDPKIGVQKPYIKIIAHLGEIKIFSWDSTVPSHTIVFHTYTMNDDVALNSNLTHLI